MSVLSFSQLIGLVLSWSLAQAPGMTKLFYASAAMLVLMTVFGYFRLPKEAAIRLPTAHRQ